MQKRKEKKVKAALTVKFLIPMLAILFVGLGIVGTIAFQSMNSVLNNQMEIFTGLNLKDIEDTILTNNDIYRMVKEDNNQRLLEKTRAVAEIIAANPEVLTTERLNSIAKSIGVNEIHVSDEKGILKYGSVPEFFGFDFSSSEQSKAFLPALTDKNFALAQEPMERGVDKVLFQYAGVARIDCPGIVQVGVAPKTLETLLKNFDLHNIINKRKFGERGYAAIANKDGVVTHHPSDEVRGKTLKDFGLESILGQEEGKLRYTLGGEAKYLQFKKMGDDYLILAIPQSEFLDPLRNMLGKIAITVILAGLISFAVVFLLMRKLILEKINKIIVVMNRVAKGELNVKADIKTNDEFRLLGDSINAASEGVGELISDVMKNSNEVAEYAESLAAATNQSAVSTEEVARAVEELAKGASEQAREAQQGTEKLMLLAEEIDSIVQNSKLMKQYADEVDKLNRHGVDVVGLLKDKFKANMDITGQVASNVNTLADKSGSVTQIVETIQNIAAQTNLLALNAAIEAARAGEAGKGFAVVAEEIRKLAEQTSVSTKEIGSIVGEIKTEISNTKSNMDAAAAVVAEANEGIADTGKAFETISSATVKMLDQIEQLAASIAKMNESKEGVVAAMQEIAAISEESAASTEEVSASVEEQTSTIEDISATAENLKHISDRLLESVKGFKI